MRNTDVHSTHLTKKKKKWREEVTERERGGKIRRGRGWEGTKEGERGRKEGRRMGRKEIYSEETGFYDTSNSDITEGGERPVENMLFTNHTKQVVVCSQNRLQLPSELIFQ